MKRWFWFLVLIAALPSPAMVVKRLPISAAAPFCGDGVKNGSDSCDASDLGGQTCAGLGYVSGSLACNVDCTFDVSGCVASSCTATGITFWWRLESADFTATNGTDDYSAGDTTATLSNATIDATRAKMGTNALSLQGPVLTSYARFTVSSDDIINDENGRLSFWFYMPTQTWEPDVRLFQLGSGANLIRVTTWNTTGQLRLVFRGNSSNTTVDSAGSILTFDAWHFIEAAWDNRGANGTHTLKLWVDNSLVAGDSSQTEVGMTANPTQMELGFSVGDDFNGATYADQLIISSDPTKDLYSCKDTTAYP